MIMVVDNKKKIQTTNYWLLTHLAKLLDIKISAHKQTWISIHCQQNLENDNLKISHHLE